MYAVAVQLTCSHEDFAENIRNLARLVDAEYRDAEIDLQAELYRLGSDADDITIPLDTVMSRLVWIAYRAGHLAAKQH